MNSPAPLIPQMINQIVSADKKVLEVSNAFYYNGFILVCISIKGIRLCFRVIVFESQFVVYMLVFYCSITTLFLAR
jgi:hypothetical protein